MPRLPLLFRCLPIVAASIAACGGGAPNDDPVAGTPDATEETFADAGPDNASPSALRLPEGRLRRLSRFELDRTAAALLPGSEPFAVATLPPDPAVLGFDNHAAALEVSATLLEAMSDAAEALADDAIVDLDALLPCDPDLLGEGPCGERFVAEFGRRAFRRPLSDATRRRYIALFEATRDDPDGGGFPGAVRSVVEAMLQSPLFLYHVELGDPDGSGRLTAHEIAARMAYQLTGAPPDDALAAAADDGSIGDPAARAAEARLRVRNDGPVRGLITHFVGRWLGLDRLHYATLDFEGARSLLPATERFVEHVVFEASGTLTELLTSGAGFVDADLALHHGVIRPDGGPDAALVSVDLDADRRPGILTRGAFLAAYGHDQHPAKAIILRGRAIREQLLCQPVEPPPAGVPLLEPEPAPGEVPVDVLAEHRANPACAGCHGMIDPIGAVFQAFDHQGLWHDALEDGTPIPTDGELKLTDVDGPVDDAADLARRLAESDQVRRCVARQWFRFSRGRLATAADAEALGLLESRLTGSGGDLQALFAATVEAPGFDRLAPVDEPSSADVGGTP